MSAAVSRRTNEATYTIHQARLGSTEFKVIRPARPLVHAVLIDRDRHLDTYLDQDAVEARCLFTALAGPPADAGEPWPLPRAVRRRHTGA